MRVREMRELSAEELKTRIDETRKNLVELRFQMALRKLESPARLKNTRKRLAQLLTIEAEKAKGIVAPERKVKSEKAEKQPEKEAPKKALKEAKAADEAKPKKTTKKAEAAEE